MAQLVQDCPRCDTKLTTFDVLADKHTGIEHRWQNWYEVFCVCRHCGTGTIFVVANRGIPERDQLDKHGGPAKYPTSISDLVRVESYVSTKDEAGVTAPEHLPPAIKAAFEEGATCHAVKCPNAAGTMFRLCVDLATQPLLPKEDEDGLSYKTRRDLGLRLPWLFDHKKLPEDLRELSSCIHQDGNDGAHKGTLTEEETEDLLDFATALLERMFTEPERLKAAKLRRDERRKPKDAAA